MCFAEPCPAPFAVPRGRRRTGLVGGRNALADWRPSFDLDFVRSHEPDFETLPTALASSLELSAALLFARCAEMRPRHRFEMCLGNWLLAGFTKSECSRAYPRQRVFDRCEESRVCCMQANLKFASASALARSMRSPPGSSAAGNGVAASSFAVSSPGLEIECRLYGSNPLACTRVLTENSTPR
jgi:hypothetical protein